MRKSLYGLAILFASMILIPSFVFGSGPFPYSCPTNEIPLYDLEYSFDLKRSTVPTGEMGALVWDICLNKEKQSLSFWILAGHYQSGKMTINIPRDNLNPQNSSCEDDIFQIDRHGKHTAIEETKTDDFREITFPILSGDTRIIIFAENPENTKSCQTKFYTLEEALEIQRKRDGIENDTNTEPTINKFPRELTIEQKDFESCKAGLNHHVSYGLGSWSVSIQGSIDNYCNMSIFHDLEGGGSDIFCSLPLGEYKASDWDSKPWYPLERDENKNKSNGFCHTIKSSSAFFQEYTVHFSPVQQIKFGILSDQVICKQDLELIFKSFDHSPVCVKEKTIEKLIQRGWATT